MPKTQRTTRVFLAGLLTLSSSCKPVPQNDIQNQAQLSSSASAVSECKAEEAFTSLAMTAVKGMCFLQYEGILLTEGGSNPLGDCQLFYGVTTPLMAAVAAGAATLDVDRFLAYMSMDDYVKNSAATRMRYSELTKKFSDMADRAWDTDLRQTYRNDARNAAAVFKHLSENPKHNFRIIHGAGYQLEMKAARTSVASFSKALARVGYYGAFGGALGIGVSIGSELLFGQQVGCAMRGEEFLEYDSDCRPKPVIGPKVANFMSMPRDEVVTALQSSPGLCRDFAAVANAVEVQISSRTEPDFEIRECNDDGSLKTLGLKWPQGDESIVRRNPDGNYQIQMNPSSKQYHVKVDSSSIPKPLEIMIDRSGFAPVTFTPADFFNGRQMMGYDLGNELRNASVNSYIFGNISQKLRDTCKNYLK